MAKPAKAPRVDDIPLGSAGPDRMIPYLVAPMVFLALLLAIVALETDHVAERWRTDLTGRATVQIPPSDIPADNEAIKQRAIAIIVQVPEVRVAEPLSEEDVGSLLQPWLGSDLALADLPVPLVIDVEYDRNQRPDFDLLNDRLAEISAGATIDDHAGALADLLSAADSLRTVAIALILIVTATSVAVVAAIVMSGLVIHRPVIELLHVCGASDGYIARQFGRHAMGGAARGAALGAGLILLFMPLAASGLAGLGRLLVLPFALTVQQWILIGAVPVAMVLASGLFAQLVARVVLSRLP
ncbi:MAG: hypothetical protein AAGF58_06410 [Pseudomonadota bacterium]